jgi:nucleotide-binding universal stress UspA family protein
MIVLVAVDGSHAALHALDTVFTFANELQHDPEIHCVSVVDYIELPASLGEAPSSAPDLLADEAETALAVAAERAARNEKRIRSHIERGPAVDTILTLAREIHADVIAVGTHGRKGLQRAVLGSTCEAILRRSEIPVLAVRKP